MTRDDIIRLAREAGLVEAGLPISATDHIARFAELIKQHVQIEQMPKFEELAQTVRAAEREECAKVCETLWDVPENGSATEEKAYGDECAAAIRNRAPCVKSCCGGKPNYTTEREGWDK